MNSNSLPFDPIFLIAPIVFCLIILEAWLKKRKQGQIDFNELITNINCGVFQQSWRVVVYIPLTFVYLYCYNHFAIFSFSLSITSFLIGFVVFDFIYYVMHWSSHHNRLLWIGHSVHHQSTDFNFSVALRQGLLAAVLTFPFYLIMAFLGFDVKSFLTISAVNAGLQFLGHTEYFNNLGILDNLLMTPKNHKVHHSADRDHSRKNLGGVLLIWDYFFNTLAPSNTAVKRFGLDKPFRTTNVLYANFQPVVDFWKSSSFVKSAKQSKKKGVKTLTLSDMGHESMQKKAIWVQVYCLIQFFLLFNSTLYFLFSHKQYSISDKLIFIFLITIGVHSIGRILSRRKYFMLIDILRATGSVVVIYILFS